MAERIEFTDNWKERFAVKGFTTFDDLFERTDPDWRIGKKRVVAPFTLVDGDSTRHLFIKRFLRPYVKDMLFTMLSAGGQCSQGRYEWDCARYLLDHGIGTYRPVCMGERTTGPIENCSFLITERLEGTTLGLYVKAKWPVFSEQQKRRLVADVARFVRRVHDAKVNFPDLYTWHIYVNETTDDKGELSHTFDIIDLHRMATGVKDPRKQIPNLGRLDHSMLDEYFTPELRTHFIESYAADNPPLPIKDIATRARKVSRALSKRRNPKPY